VVYTFLLVRGRESAKQPASLGPEKVRIPQIVMDKPAAARLAFSPLQSKDIRFGIDSRAKTAENMPKLSPL
jgi:hypothetical protein